MNYPLVFFWFLFFGFDVCAHHDTYAIDHAPIGVMGDHTHHTGEVMTSVRYMGMSMKGMRSGTQNLSAGDYSQNIKPQKMNMHMFMLGGMYGVTDKLTLMLMANLTSKNMTLKNHTKNTQFDTSSSSIGDVSLKGLYNILKTDRHYLVGSLGISAPVGSIKKKGNIPMMGYTQLPYPMQIGSGTWDPSIGLTYKLNLSDFQYGTQLNYKFRLGHNDLNYHFGNQLGASVWGAYQLVNWFSTSVRANWKWRGDIKGSDKSLSITSMMNPTANPNNWGGNWLNLFLGGNFVIHNSHRLAFEIGIPVAQNLHGPQMKQNYQFTIGHQFAF